MADYAPQALIWLGSKVRPDLGGTLSGIVGDAAHTYGYHRGPAYIPSSDYSKQLSEDKQSPSAYMASAIDMSFSDAKMRLYTGRLKAAADRNDPRLKYIREFYGTLDSVNVYGRTHDGSGDSSWERSSADNTHLWHIHISILRKYCNTQSVMQGLLDILAGKSTTPTPPPPPAKPTTHTVKSGETLTSIANKYKVTVAQLQSWNKITNPNLIRIGQVLKIVASVSAPKFPLPAGHYFGLITGPNESHGGFYASEKPHIKKIQEKLQALKYAPSVSGWADGIYEQPTVDAVKKFQKAKGLSQDGRVGVNTWNKLFSS